MRVPLWALVVWIIIIVVVASAGGYWGYQQGRTRTQELNEIAPLDDGVDAWHTIKLLAGWEEPALPDQVRSEPPSARQPSATAPTPSHGPPDSTQEPVNGATPDGADPTLPTGVWPDPRRVNILLLGIDQRQGETGPFRTDTIMVLSLNPAAKTGAMLSIPRDLWVDFPAGLGPDRINNANVTGETVQYPGGGPEFSKRTVGQLLGIPIHYYVMVNFDAFVTFVGAIGEVEVCPEVPIDDPKYPDGSYGYKHVTFEAGCQSLNGERLLEYARTRATANSDIDRANRQQETILAIRKAVVSVGGATALLREATTIWESVQDNVRTDLSLDDMINLALLAEAVPAENIRNTSVSYGEVLIDTGPNAEEILIPIPGDILALVNELFR